jgi:hypothetical protein
MLPVPEKVLENCVYNQVINFVNSNNILFQQQCGFRENHSCESVLNIAVNKWKEGIRKNKIIDCVFLDF